MSTVVGGAKFVIRHRNPLLFSISSVSSKIELFSLSVEKGGKLISISDDTTVIYQIESLELYRELLLYKVIYNIDAEEHLESQRVHIGTLSVKTENDYHKIFQLNIVDMKYGRDLIVQLSRDGAEYTVLRDDVPIIQFISSRGPIGKSGGIFKVASRERKNFAMALASSIYIAQVSLPKKECFFRFCDTNQNPVFLKKSVVPYPLTSSIKTNSSMTNPVRDYTANSESTISTSISRSDRIIPLSIGKISTSVTYPRRRTSELISLRERSTKGQRFIARIKIQRSLTEPKKKVYEKTSEPYTDEDDLSKCWDQLEALASVQETENDS